jgi:carbamoyl-phosphate synthase large subunit
MSGAHKQAMIEPARKLRKMGFRVISTSGTAKLFNDAGIDVETIKKVQEGRPNLLDMMVNGDVQFIFNTPSGKGSRTDEGRIRAAAVMYGVPCVTTLPGCYAMVQAIEYLLDHPAPSVRSLQEWHGAEVEAR